MTNSDRKWDPKREGKLNIEIYREISFKNIFLNNATFCDITSQACMYTYTVNSSFFFNVLHVFIHLPEFSVLDENISERHTKIHLRSI